MKPRKNIYNVLFIITIFLFVRHTASGQTNPDSTQFRSIGYKDANRDGINDLFSDTNGDGINDVTNKVYPHAFKFEDKNKDGKNDIWLDKDGDGVNDLMRVILKQMGLRPKAQWVDKDGDGIQDSDVKPTYKADLSQFVLDANHDRKNDITGLEITKDKTMGYRYGCIDEEKNKELKRFIDKNADGMHDNFTNRLARDMGRQVGKRQYDYFIDADGDGISDGRGFNRRGKYQHGKKNNRKR